VESTQLAGNKASGAYLIRVQYIPPFSRHTANERTSCLPALFYLR